MKQNMYYSKSKRFPVSQIDTVFSVEETLSSSHDMKRGLMSHQNTHIKSLLKTYKLNDSMNYVFYVTELLTVIKKP